MTGHQPSAAAVTALAKQLHRLDCEPGARPGHRWSGEHLKQDRDKAARALQGIYADDGLCLAPHPNAIMPCGTDSARRRHLARGDVYGECNPDDAPIVAERERRTAGVVVSPSTGGVAGAVVDEARRLAVLSGGTT